jgi:hypothetical protein
MVKLFDTYLTLLFIAIVLCIGSTVVSCIVRTPMQATDNANTKDICYRMSEFDHGSRNRYVELDKELCSLTATRNKSFNRLEAYLQDSIQDINTRVEGMGKRLVWSEELLVTNDELSSEVDKLYKRTTLASADIAAAKQNVYALKAKLQQLKWNSEQIDAEIIDLESRVFKIEVEMAALDSDNSNKKYKAEREINTFKFEKGIFLGDGVEVSGTKNLAGFRTGEQDHIKEILVPGLGEFDESRTNVDLDNARDLLPKTCDQLRAMYTKAAVDAYDKRKLDMTMRWLRSSLAVRSYRDIASAVKDLTSTPPAGTFLHCENLTAKGYFAIYKTLVDAAMVELKRERARLNTHLQNYTSQLTLTDYNVGTLQGIQAIMEQVRHVIENNRKLIILDAANTATYNANIDTCNRFLSQLTIIELRATPGNYKSEQASDFCIAFDIRTISFYGLNSIITSIGENWYGELYEFSYSSSNVRNSNPLELFPKKGGWGKWTDCPGVGRTGVGGVGILSVWVGKERGLKAVNEPIVNSKSRLDTKFEGGYLTLA